MRLELNDQPSVLSDVDPYDLQPRRKDAVSLNTFRREQRQEMKGEGMDLHQSSWHMAKLQPRERIHNHNAQFYTSDAGDLDYWEMPSFHFSIWEDSKVCLFILWPILNLVLANEKGALKVTEQTRFTWHG